MSRDAQARPAPHPQPLPLVSEALRGRLKAIGHNPPPDLTLLSCAGCHSGSAVYVFLELTSGEFHVECTHCERTTIRTYRDPVTAILRWNGTQMAWQQDEQIVKRMANAAEDWPA